jgi:hypothetical protein
MYMYMQSKIPYISRIVTEITLQPQVPIGYYYRKKKKKTSPVVDPMYIGIPPGY